MKTIVTILILFISQLTFAIKPEKEYKMRPSDLEMEFEEYRIKTVDGAALNTWVMKPSERMNRDITVLIVGSDAGNMGYTVFYAKNLVDLGYKVVSFDYRGFGDSTDFKYNPDNVYHSEYITDFETVMNWCKSNLESKRVGVFGLSMGTLIANIGYHTSQYDFFVGEAFVWSPSVNKQRIQEIKDKELNLPVNVKKDEQLVTSAKVPTLLFAGSQDEITTAEDSKQYCSTRTDSRTIEFDGGHLRGIVDLGVEDYFDSIHKFILGY